MYSHVFWITSCHYRSRNVKNAFAVFAGFLLSFFLPLTGETLLGKLSPGGGHWCAWTSSRACREGRRGRQNLDDKKTSAASSENQGNKSGCEKRSSMRQLRFWWWGSQLRQTVFSSSTMCVSSCESTGILRTRRTLDSFKVFCVSMPSCRSRRCHTEQELKSSLALWDL